MSENQTENKDYKEGFRKLYLPEWCLIPKEVKKDNNLSSDEKIFFGELNVLANERGYCWGTDEEFSNLKGLGERTIQRYFSNMEMRGHITRETVSVPYKNGDGVLRWKKDRKIWMGKKELKKFANPPIVSSSLNPPNLAVSVEPAKSGGILIIKKDKKNNKPDSPSAVVVSSILNKLEIEESLKQKITKTYTEAQIAKAISCLENMYPDNLEATLQAALRDGWEPNTPSEDLEAKNKVYLDSLRHWEGKQIGRYRADISPTMIMFRHSCIDGSKDVFYKIDQKGFISAVKAFLAKNDK